MVTAQSAAGPRPTKEPSVLEEPLDFSLVVGGPTFQLLRRLLLSGSGLELLHRRLLLVVMVTWVPLLVLTAAGSLGDAGRISFFHSLDVHARFLIALPIMIAGELLVHSRIPSAVQAFVRRGIVFPQDLPRYGDAVRSAVNLRNSMPLELAILALVYSVGLWTWNGRMALNLSTWCGMVGGRWQLTPAGYWYVFVSLPMFQFVLLRWYMRIAIWFRFLWQVSRMKLNLFPTHPDRCSGISFLGNSAYAFGPVLFAHGTVLAGVVATRVIYKGDNLLSFKVQALGFVILFVAAALAPLMMFSPQMAAAKRKATSEYGLLAQKYVEKFDRKWVSGGANEELLGTSDIQSLADLANSYDILRELRTVPVPFGLKDIGVLSVAAAAPFVPLVLIVYSPEEVIMRIIKMAF